MQGYFKETCGIVQTNKRWTRGLSGSKAKTKYAYLDCSEAPFAENADTDATIIPVTYVPYLKPITKKKRVQNTEIQTSLVGSKCEDKFEGCKKNGSKILCKVKVGSRDGCENSYALSTNIHALCCW